MAGGETFSDSSSACKHAKLTVVKGDPFCPCSTLHAKVKLLAQHGDKRF